MHDGTVLPKTVPWCIVNLFTITRSLAQLQPRTQGLSVRGVAVSGDKTLGARLRQLRNGPL